VLTGFSYRFPGRASGGLSFIHKLNGFSEIIGQETTIPLQYFWRGLRKTSYM
jgi:hypothetical protein